MLTLKGFLSTEGLAIFNHFGWFLGDLDSKICDIQLSKLIRKLQTQVKIRYCSIRSDSLWLCFRDLFFNFHDYFLKKRTWECSFWNNFNTLWRRRYIIVHHCSEVTFQNESVEIVKTTFSWVVFPVKIVKPVLFFNCPLLHFW